MPPWLPPPMSLGVPLGRDLAQRPALGSMLARPRDGRRLTLIGFERPRCDDDVPHTPGRRDRRVPENEVVRVTRHGRHGAVLFEAEMP